MKILITGSEGQLGNELIEIIKSGRSDIGFISEEYSDAVVKGVDIKDVDISDVEALKNFFSDEKYDVVINCAAMTNVDACETDYTLAMKVNAIGARNMAMVASEMDAKILHVSTDYVFEGNASKPYTEWDIPNPITVYGKSKLLGEGYVTEKCSKTFVVRTSWLYGKKGNNFVKTIIKLSSEKDNISVVNDQIGNPTNANDLAHHILKLILTEEYGVYHCTGNGICSWYDFASEIVKLSSNACIVTPCTTEEFPRPAPRPAYSAMNHTMLESTVGDEMRDWKSALEKYLECN